MAREVFLGQKYSPQLEECPDHLQEGQESFTTFSVEEG